MAAPLSREGVIEFIDYASAKGLVNKATAAARKAAAKRVFAILEPHEAQDVTKLDLDELMHRFSNLEGGAFTPESLSAYRSRLRTLLDDFVAWKQDPIGFRPKGGGANARAKPPRVSKVDPAKPASKSQEVASQAGPATQTHSVPIPIRADLTVFFHGVPFDLSKAEAKRISNVILALAMDGTES